MAGIAALVALVLMAPPQSIAQDDDEGADSKDVREYKYVKGSAEITAAFASKKLKIESGLAAKDRLQYAAMLSGEMTAAGEGVATRIANTTNVQLNVDLKEHKDATELDAEFRMARMDIEQDHDGKKLSFSAFSGKDSGNGKIWIDGKPAERDETEALPNPSRVGSKLKDPVAFARIGDNNELSRAAHAAEVNTSDAKNLPQHIVDPLVFARLLFAGYADREIAVGEAVEIKANLALDTARGETHPYTIKLTLRKVFGEGEKAASAQFEVSAMPAAGELRLSDTISVTPPELSGTMLLDVTKGVVASASLSGSYKSAKGASIEGTVKINLDLESKKGSK